jgi:hypothetical protein
MNKSLNVLVKNIDNKLAFSSANFGKYFSTTTQSKQKNKVLNKDNIFENVLKVEYAVRGPIVVKAGQLENELKKVCLIIIFQVFIHSFCLRALNYHLIVLYEQILVIAMQLDKNQLHF